MRKGRAAFSDLKPSGRSLIRPWKAAWNSIEAAEAGRTAAAGCRNAGSFPQGDFTFRENLSTMDFGIRLDGAALLAQIRELGSAGAVTRSRVRATLC